MIEELATVVAINNQASEQYTVTVESQIKSTCSGCKQVDNCGSGQVSKAIPQRRLRLDVSTDKALSIGDIVVLGLSEKNLLSTAWQVYLWPLIGLISFSSLGQWLMGVGIFSHELFALAIGLVGGYLGFRLAKFWQTFGKNTLALMPKIIRIVPQELQLTSPA